MGLKYKLSAGLLRGGGGGGPLSRKRLLKKSFFFTTTLMLWAHGVLNQFQFFQEIWILCGCKPNTFFPVQLYTCIIMRTSEKLRVQYITAFYTIVGIHPIFAFSYTIHQLQVLARILHWLKILFLLKETSLDFALMTWQFPWDQKDEAQVWVIWYPIHICVFGAKHVPNRVLRQQQSVSEKEWHVCWK